MTALERVQEYRHGIRGEGPDVDPVDHGGSDDLFWTTANIGEAAPGVITPLTWTLFGPAIEAMVRRSFVALGAFTEAQLPYPPRDDYRHCRAFNGRTAMNVDALADFGDRMPGTSGVQVVEGFIGKVPADMTFAPTNRRALHVVRGLVRQHRAMPKALAEAAPETARWWRAEIARIPSLDDPAEVAEVFHAAAERFFATLHIQGMMTFACVQPTYDLMTQVARRGGLENATALTSGYSDVPETAVVTALWRASRDEISIEDVIAEFGFHGPHEGELSGTMWREDPTPVLKAVEGYRKRPDSEDPRSLQRAQRARRLELEAQLLDGTPRPLRPALRKLLRHAETIIPQRGVAKDAFLQAFDVARAAARRFGELQVDAGVFAAADDVFQLRVEEVRMPLAPDIADRIAFRAARRAEHLAVRIPPNWQGRPTVIPDGAGTRRDLVTGTGVSSGRAEGIVRVVSDGHFDEVEEGEILVAATTDPSWAAVLFLSSALVVDIGGHLSHAAIVARELGVPCVVNTVDGTSALRTGDRVVVDGDAGTVTVLEPAAEDAAPVATEPATDGRAIDLDPEDLPLVQTVRLKGRAKAAEVAAVLGRPADGVATRLAELVDVGVLTEKSSRFRLSPVGTAAIAAALDAERSVVDAAVLEQVHEEFVPINREFKTVVSAWQMRDGEPNDHTDAAYDADVLARVTDIHARLTPLLTTLAKAVPRLGTYAPRFADAADKVGAGEQQWLLDPRLDSFHTVWFELHEELIGLSGRDRLTEAAAGRAE